MLFAQVHIPRRHRQPVGLTNDRHGNDARRDIEIGDHLPDEHQLLVILLTEVRAVRRHDLQQFEHDREHSGEVRWT
ncbi:Uncharacterised protein [Mycobacteroides abscessus subsp. abscessus]|nr:Uncharacterised protein [Mycobacteroides abscessus subsp. abscessus]